MIDPLVLIATLAASALGAREVAEEALRTAIDRINAERRSETFWKKVFYAIGLPSTILSAAAGVTVVTWDNKVITAILAFASAVLGALFTFLRPDARMEAARRKADQWEAQKLAITVLEKVDLGDEQLDHDEVVRRLRPILDEQVRLLTGELPPSQISAAPTTNDPTPRNA
jgi:hypothetical protein